jgi:hypothetical protein
MRGYYKTLSAIDKIRTYRTQTPYTFFGHKAFTAISYPGEGAKSQDEFTFPLIFFIIPNFHNKLKRQQYFRYFIFNRF